MKSFLRLGLLLTVTILLFTGCRTATINNIEANNFTAISNSSVTLDRVAKEIIGAGVSLGWQMRRVSDGEIIATLFLRNHMAQVRIPFTTKDYSIIYKSSKNLKHDASNDTIHSNYNGWIQNLDNAIQTRLGML